MGWKFYNSTGHLLTAPSSTASADLATEATNVTVTANNSENADIFPVFVDGVSGTQGIETDSGFTYNPSSGLLVIAGELDAGSLDVSGNADIDGTLEADAITIDTVTLAEYISDTVGAMVASNTETNIAVTYEDSDNTLDFVVASDLNTTGNAGTVTTNANLTGDVTSSGNAATLVLSNLTGAAINVANDSIPFLDSDGSATRIESIADLATAMAGTNLTASSGQLVASAAGTSTGFVIAMS